LSLQTIARTQVFGYSPDGDHVAPGGGDKPKAVVVTTLPVSAILPTLRDAIRSQAQSKLGARNPAAQSELRRCLEATSISRIFDIEGLWEVLHELESTAETNIRGVGNASEKGEVTSIQTPRSDQHEEPQSRIEEEVKTMVNGSANKDATTDSIPNDQSNPSLLQQSLESMASSPGPVTSLPPLRIGTELQPLVRKAEIQDSEDEEGFSSSPLSSIDSAVFAPELSSPCTGHVDSQANPEAHTPSAIPISTTDPESEPDSQPQKPHEPPSEPTKETGISTPDIIVVTHFSSLLRTLFTHCDKASAHTNLQLLSLRLRRLARSAAGPLIMLLNTTASPSTMPSKSGLGAFPSDPNHPANSSESVTAIKRQRPLDPTLRSIFDTAPQPRGGYGNVPIHGYDHGYGHGYDAGSAAGPGRAAAALMRRNKPSFGAMFAQFLDLHLLCTKVPRTREDAEAAVALGTGAGIEGVKYAWVVEVLLDELGALDWKRTGADKEKDNSNKKKQGGNENRIPKSLPPRTNRERRWGAVDVRDGEGGGARIVNAFAATGTGGG
jgi:hypothetical protein